MHINRWETLNLYEKENYNGFETKLENDVSIVENNGTRLSAIVTGCSPWTIYEYALKINRIIISTNLYLDITILT